jgi:hypothetical protein
VTDNAKAVTPQGSEWQTESLSQTYLNGVRGAIPCAGTQIDLYQFHLDSGSSRSRKELAREYYARPDKRENILAPVETQCAWLRAIGFQDVDCFFKLFELALFGGRKRK